MNYDLLLIAGSLLICMITIFYLWITVERLQKELNIKENNKQ